MNYTDKARRSFILFFTEQVTVKLASPMVKDIDK